MIFFLFEGFPSRGTALRQSPPTEVTEVCDYLVDAAGGGLVQAVGPPDLVTQPQCVEAPHLRVLLGLCVMCVAITVLQ